MTAPWRIQPRLLKAADAAVYLGISPTKLRDLDLPRRVMGGNRLYDIRDLDAYADSLPYEGQVGDQRRANSCDEALGL